MLNPAPGDMFRFFRAKATMARHCHTIAAVAFILLYCAASALTLNGQVAWGDDFAQYLMHARALAAGHAYSDIGYVWSSDAPFIGPPLYPPGTAFVLAPVFLIFGYSLEIAKLTMIICFGVFLLAFYFYLSEVGSRTVALATLVLVALTPVFWRETQSIGSENPFLAFCYLGLFLIATREGARGPWAEVAYSLLLGLVIFLAYATRQVGVILLLSVLIFDTLRWRGWPMRVLPMLAVFVCGAIWENRYLAGARGFDDLMFGALRLGRVSDIFNLVNSFRGFAYGGGRVDMITGGMFLLLSAIGCGFSLKPAAAALRTRQSPLIVRLVLVVRAVPVPVTFIVGNVLLLLILPFGGGERYLMPFAPILFWYAVMATSLLLRHTHRPRMATALATLVTAVLVAITYRTDRAHASAVGLPTSPPAQALFAAVDRLVPEDEIVVFAKPRAMALFSGRKSMGWPTVPDRNWAAFLARHNVKNFAVSRPYLLTGEIANDLEELKERTNPTTVFQNEDFILYRIKE